MSQPPPPPSQPPNQPENQPPDQQPAGGGFGAPQEPSYGYPQQPPNQPPGQAPQGGDYGYPQQPPNQPPGQPSQGGGYGYPQASGQPPQGGGYGYPQVSGQPPQGGGYGYPGQQPGPYGYPQPGPYGQQPTYPMPGPGGQPPSSGGNTKLVIIVASVVAVALIAVGGVFFLTKGGDDTGDESQGDTKGISEGTDGDGADSKGGESQQDGRAELAWKKDSPPVVDERIAYTSGTWFAGDNVIRYSVDSVVAYNLQTGKQAWEIKAPRARHCAAAPQTSEDKTFIVWGRKCEKAMLIDLVKGKSVWDKDLPAREGRDDADVSYPYAAISGDMAGVAWIGGSAAYRVSDGKLLWSAKSGTTCADRAYIGGGDGEFISLVECGFRDEYRLQSLTASGATKWEWKAPQGVRVRRVLSTDPLVVGVSAGGGSSHLTDIMVLSVSGKTAKVRQKFNLDEEERFDVRCSDIGPTSCYNTIVDKDNDVMYVATKLHTGGDSGGRINEVVAFNLSTGKNKWVSEAANGRETTPLAVHDGKLLTYEKGDFSGDGTVMALDPKSGKASEYVELPTEERELSRITGVGNGRPYWHEDALFLVREQVFQDQNLNKEGGLAVFR